MAVTYKSTLPLMSAYEGGLNPSMQHFILKEGWSVLDGSEISQRVYCGRENGVMGSLETRRVAEGDWERFVSRHRRSIFWWLRMVGFVLPSGVAPGWH